MIRKLADLFKNKEIRIRIIFTLAMLLVYRLGTVIPVPNVDRAMLSGSFQPNSLLEMMNVLGGGMLQSFSVFSLGVGPYITSSIIIQLLSMDVIPYLTELGKSGQKGKKQIDRITRYLAIVLAYVQSFSIIYYFQSQSYSIFLDTSPASYFFMATIMSAGTMFLLWMGDQITTKGMGNGLSMIIFAGIVSSMPNNFITAFNSMVTSSDIGGILTFALYVLSYFLIIILVIFMNQAVRKITIQYSSSSGAVRGKNVNHLPLKINSASVIPVIFAGAIMQAPIIVLSYLSQGTVYQFLSTYFVLTHPVGIAIYAVLIIAFTFFYTNLQVDPEKIAENFGKNGSYIPGVRPGKDTKNYIGTILNRITVLGALFLTFVALLPHVLPLVVSSIPASTAPGGTGIIIVVGVALETVKELQGRATQRSYKGFLNR